jgi:hypothetical protein
MSMICGGIGELQQIRLLFFPILFNPSIELFSAFVKVFSLVIKKNLNYYIPLDREFSRLQNGI